jgi:hypothetical protein
MIVANQPEMAISEIREKAEEAGVDTGNLFAGACLSQAPGPARFAPAWGLRRAVGNERLFQRAAVR